MTGTYSFADHLLQGVQMGLQKKRDREQLALAKRQQTEQERANLAAEDDRDSAHLLNVRQLDETVAHNLRTYALDKGQFQLQKEDFNLRRDELLREGRVELEPGVFAEGRISDLAAFTVPLFVDRKQRELTQSEGRENRSNSRWVVGVQEAGANARTRLQIDAAAAAREDQQEHEEDMAQMALDAEYGPDRGYTNFDLETALGELPEAPPGVVASLGERFGRYVRRRAVEGEIRTIQQHVREGRLPAERAQSTLAQLNRRLEAIQSQRGYTAEDRAAYYNAIDEMHIGVQGQINSLSRTPERLRGESLADSIEDLQRMNEFLGRLGDNRATTMQQSLKTYALGQASIHNEFGALGSVYEED